MRLAAFASEPGRAGAALAGLAIVAMSAAGGGYFAPAWGLGALGFALATAALFIAAEEVELGRFDVAILAALGALVAWTALSIAWSESVPRTILEVQRGLLYVTGLGGLLLLIRRSGVPLFLIAVMTAIGGIAAYALATRLFPDVFGYAAGGPYQLQRPIGYWNALAILTVLGLVLALGIAAEAPRRVRALAAGVIPVLAATVYFTFSRGGWVALAAGLTALVVLSPRRSRLAAVAVVVVPFAAVTVLLSTRSDALTRAGAPVEDAARDGHRLAVVIVALSALAALASTLVDAAHARLRLGPRGRRAAALAVAVAAVAGAAAAVVSAGGPGELVGRANDAFRGPFTQTGGDLNARLLSTSGNSRADYWEIAWRTGARAPLHGTGGGTYDIAWYRDRPGHLSVRDAHSLYLETFAELGVPGVLALAVALLVPFAALRSRRDWAAAAAVGAYVAYLVHAGLDWDWEVPAVTLAALACAAAAVATARPPGSTHSVSRPLRIAVLAAAALVATVAFVGYLGAESLFASRTSFDAGRFAAARSEAARATALAPWSSEALLMRGQAELALGHRSAARRDFRRAVAKDPNDWQMWYRLGLAAEGAERARAAREVARLNPLGIEAEILGH